MSRPQNKLTAMEVSNQTTQGWYGDGGGLWLQVSKTGSKSWVLRYYFQGKARYMGLGPCRIVSLKEARDQAWKAQEKLTAGIDPLDDRRKQELAAQIEKAKRITFEQCAMAYIEAHSKDWSNIKHKAQWESTLRTYAFPLIGGLPVEAVDKELLVRCLEPIWKDKNETANRVRGRIEAILNYATIRGYRQGENPARWKGHLEILLGKRSNVSKGEHHAAMPYKEIAAFFLELKNQSGIAARCLEFLILTATRTSEVLGTKWEEIDLTEKRWTIPASRMKAGKEHRIPLSNSALSLLETMADLRMGEYAFPGQNSHKPMSQMAMMMLLRRMRHGDFTVHGFRSTFRDWGADCTSYPNIVLEMALSHAVSDKVEAAYRRGDMFEKRTALMNDWAVYVDGIKK
ncbi:MAG: integrase arm-type DNA-binding domain-containing protein [Magnetococcales bacterium]|nr:integrase arm-type DNA-binding domain-containing protein [Magnetococcales bacterium]